MFKVGRDRSEQDLNVLVSKHTGHTTAKTVLTFDVLLINWQDTSRLLHDASYTMHTAGIRDGKRVSYVDRKDFRRADGRIKDGYVKLSFRELCLLETLEADNNTQPFISHRQSAEILNQAHKCDRDVRIYQE